MEQTYHLRDGVHACVHRGRFVFLDLNNDRYSTLDAAASETVGDVLRASSTDDPARHPDRAPQSAPCPTIEDLLRSRILTRDPGRAASTPVCDLMPGRDELPQCLFGEVAIRPRDVWRMTLSYASALVHLKAGGLGHAVRRVARRRRPPHAGRSRNDVSALLYRFQRLTPLFATKRDHCLFVSYLLIDFMRRNDVDAEWWFGVKLDGFYAHCWVQADDVLLGEDAEMVDQFTVIMKV